MVYLLYTNVVTSITATIAMRFGMKWTMMPDYRERKEWLRKHGASLEV